METRWDRGKRERRRRRKRPRGRNECAKGRWYFQFHRAWVNEAHEGRREVRATTLRNFPARRQNWRRRVGHIASSSFPARPFKRVSVLQPPSLPLYSSGAIPGVAAHYLRWLPGPSRGVCHPVALETHTFRSAATLSQVRIRRDKHRLRKSGRENDVFGCFRRFENLTRLLYPRVDVNDVT